jgi:hypothetical protein
MSGHDDLDDSGWVESRARFLPAFASPCAEVFKENRLKLRVQMRLGLLHQQDRQIVLVGPRQLDDDHRNVEKVRVAESGGCDLRRLDTPFGKHHAHETREAPQFVRTSAYVRLVLSRRMCELLKLSLHGRLDSLRKREGRDSRYEIVRLSPELLRVVIGKHPEHLGEPGPVSGPDFSYRVAKRREIDMRYSFSKARLCVGRNLIPH